MGYSLIAFDTNAIKQYVFGTRKLKEIRGASSLLDSLNRWTMKDESTKSERDGKQIYANGGGGLFIVKTEKAEEFGQAVQKKYNECSGGGLTVTYVWQELPDTFKKDDETTDISEYVKLLQWRLQERKLQPAEAIVLPSHPFLRQCSACGLEYAGIVVGGDVKQKEVEEEPNSEDEVVDDREAGEAEDLYCLRCQKKRLKDQAVKKGIQTALKKYRQGGTKGQVAFLDGTLWNRVLISLAQSGYDFPSNVDRPSDFNVFGELNSGKRYMALIYADANNMGQKLNTFRSIAEIETFARIVDDAIYDAVCDAILAHLRIEQHPREGSPKKPVFPFDILMLGGDDVIIAVPATVAFDVAVTIARRFREHTVEKISEAKRKGVKIEEEGYTLSASVVLAPVKYPFNLLREMAESTLKFAKASSADARVEAHGYPTDDTRINFMVVTGSSSSQFKTVYDDTYHALYENKAGRGGFRGTEQEFFATLRPYTLDNMQFLLQAIREGQRRNLGRTKLHQVREAILKMNLTSSVIDGLALLTNWSPMQRSYVAQTLYHDWGTNAPYASDSSEFIPRFPRVTFPWFADEKPNGWGMAVYRTCLLDFVELYDFVSREETEDGEED